MTEPRLDAGVITLIAVGVVLVTVAERPPKVTTAPVWKAEPEMVTAVPPERDPVVTDRFVMAGGDRNLKAAASEPDCLSGFVTLTGTAPDAWAGVTAVMVVPLTTVTFVALPES